MIVISLAGTNPIVIGQLDLKLGQEVAGLQIVSGLIFVQLAAKGAAKGAVEIFEMEEWSLVTNVLPDDWDSKARLQAVEVVLVQQQILLLATLDTIGLGTLTLLKTAEGVTKQGKDLARLVGPVYPGLENFITKTNRFVQSRVTDLHGNATAGLNVTLVMLSSESAHLKVLFELAGSQDQGYSFAKASFVQAFNRYGNHAVLPMLEVLCHVNCQCTGNGFITAYESKGVVSYLLYNYGGKALMETKGGLQHEQAGKVTFLPFSGLLLYNDNGLAMAEVSNNVSLVFTNVSSSVSSQKINISAVSDYSLAMFEYEVKFNSSSNWVFYLFIVLLIVFVLVAVGGTVFWKLRKNRLEQQDPLVESERPLR